jgi:FkbM family methyltransferase
LDSKQPLEEECPIVLSLLLLPSSSSLSLVLTTPYSLALSPFRSLKDMARTAKTTAASTAAARGAVSFLLGLGAAAALLSLASSRRTWAVLDYDLVSAKCFQGWNGAGSAGTTDAGAGTGTVRGGHGGGAADLPATAAAVPASPSTQRSSNSNSNSNNHNNNNVDPLVTKRSGKGWEVWDRKSVLHEEFGDAGAGGTPCNWQEYKAVGRRYKSGNEVDNGAGAKAGTPADRDSRLPPVFMCLYPLEQDQFVSWQIQTQGVWGNCNTLTKRLLQGGGGGDGHGVDAAAAAAATDTRNLVYMDVGANIGACVVQILSTTDATVVAFEPNPKNLFRLTSTLMNLPEEMKSRVTLFPVALGSEPSGTATIVADPRNAGNTQVVRAAAAASATASTSPGGDHEKGVTGATVATHNIPVERMDDLFSKALRVDLLKLDVQGFECFVLAGMKSVLSGTRRMFFEVEEELLKRFRGHPGRACSGAALVQTLQRSGFQVQQASGAPAENLAAMPDADLAKITFRNQDMFAERPTTTKR